MILLDFLKLVTGVEPSVLKNSISNGKVKVNGIVVEKYTTKLTCEYRIPSVVEYEGNSYSFYLSK